MFVMGPFRCGQEFKVIFLKNNAFQKCLQRTLENSLFSIFVTEEKKIRPRSLLLSLSAVARRKTSYYAV